MRKSVVTVAVVLTLSVGLIGCGYEAIPEGQYTLAISSSRCGYVSSPGEGVFVYDEGTVVELMASSVGNSPFVKWTGDVTAVADVEAAATSITMNDDYAVKATFSCGYEMCFIATAAYDTAMAKEIQILRRFRDEYLLGNPVGQGLVEIYYAISPPITDFITKHSGLKPVVRAGLRPIITMCSAVLDKVPQFAGNETSGTACKPVLLSGIHTPNGKIPALLRHHNSP